MKYIAVIPFVALMIWAVWMLYRSLTQGDGYMHPITGRVHQARTFMETTK